MQNSKIPRVCKNCKEFSQLYIKVNGEFCASQFGRCESTHFGNIGTVNVDDECPVHEFDKSVGNERHKELINTFKNISMRIDGIVSQLEEMDNAFAEYKNI